MEDRHGGNIYDYGENTIAADFSASINPMGMPESARLALAACAEACEAYPDPECRELIKAISSIEGVPERNIVCGNGASQLISLAVRARKPRRALLTAPSFLEYERALLNEGASCASHTLSPDDGFTLTESYLEDLSDDIDMVFLCSPNNPTGQLVRPSLMEQIHDKCIKNGTLMVVDECFLELTGLDGQYTMRGRLSMGNLLIIKALTKTYAMPGLRAGYALCGSEKMADLLRSVQEPWSVSVPAQIAGAAALKEEGYIKRSAELIASEREYLIEALSSFPVRVIGASANFIFFYSEMPRLKERLLSEGILIRDCSSFKGLGPGYYRIAVRPRRENDLFIMALYRISGGIDG